MDGWQAISNLFRSVYDAAAREHAAAWRPVLEVHEDRILKLRTERGDHGFAWEAGPVEADLRRLSHVPLLMYLVTKAPDGHAAGTRQVGETVDEMLGTLPARGLTDAQLVRNRRLLVAAKELLDRIRCLGPDRTADVADLAKQVRPIIDANLADAARLNLDALSVVIHEMVGLLNEGELERLVVLNRGNKSARIGNQVDLYMRAVLGDEAADRRLVFAEGVDDIDEARQVLGSYLLDRAIGDDFFGDPLTMRTDVLGSPTTEELQRRIDAGLVPQRRPARPEPDGRG